MRPAFHIDTTTADIQQAPNVLMDGGDFVVALNIDVKIVGNHHVVTAYYTKYE